MTEPNLSELLNNLHEELQHVESVDEKGRDLLSGIDVEIHALLDRSSRSAQETSLTKDLRSTLDHFEITHPKLTMAISEMLNTLNNGVLRRYGTRISIRNWRTKSGSNTLLLQSLL